MSSRAYFGAVHIRVQGNVQAFLRAALAQGVQLWDVRVEGAVLGAWVSWYDVPRLRVPARRARSRVRLGRRRGLLPLLAQLGRRPVLVWGGVILVILYVGLATRVWTVQVGGLRRVGATQVLAAAARAGLRPGAWLPAVSPPGVARRVMEEVPGVTWAGVTLDGTSATVEVVERLPPPPSPPRPIPGAPLVARENGLVTAVHVFRGTALVSPGDTVVAGQPLIAGWEEVPRTGQAQAVVAEGEVWARVWREAVVTVPLVLRTWRPVGPQRWEGRLLVGGRLVLRVGRGFASGVPARKVLAVWRWRNPVAPVEWMTERAVRVQLIVRRRSRSRAEALGRARALRQWRARLRPGAEVRALWATSQVQGDRARVRVVMETQEQVAIPPGDHGVAQADGEGGGGPAAGHPGGPQAAGGRSDRVERKSPAGYPVGHP